MAKFAIECPNCGQYAEAKKGWFAGIFGTDTKGLFGTKQIDCPCGNLIDVRTDSLASRQCPDCGNMVAYDQSKADSASCPVCKSKKVSSPSVSNISMADFSCPQCGCGLRAEKSTSTYECPICEMVIADVQKQIYQTDVSRSGLASVIKYEGGNDVFVWKHPVEDFNIGSQLIVHETQEAIFFRDGQALDSFTAGRYTLETASIPLINRLYNSMLDPSGVFHSEVYFVNLTTQMGIKWGTDSKVRFLEPVTGIPFEIGASGEFNLRVIDVRTLVMELVGTESGLDRAQLLSTSQADGSGMKGYFRALIMTRVKTLLAKTIKEKAINILEVDEHLDELSDALRIRLNEGLAVYGLTLPEFFVTNLATPDSDKNFQRLKQQHAEQYLRVRDEQVRKAEAEAALERKTVEARTDAQMRIIDAQGGAEARKISAQADAEAYRLQAEAEALEMQMKGYTYTQETQRQVGLEAVKGGIIKEGSGGAGGGLGGGIAGLGVELAAVGAVMGLTKDAIAPLSQTTTEIGQSFGGLVKPADTTNPNLWDCACGEKGITKNFCANCGEKKPAPKEAWDCLCGEKGIIKNFCPDCGTKRPAPPETWNCACGETGNIKKFCANCGLPKPTATTWDCECGNKAIAKKFCDECGKKRENEPGGA